MLYKQERFAARRSPRRAEHSRAAHFGAMRGCLRRDFLPNAVVRLRFEDYQIFNRTK